MKLDILELLIVFICIVYAFYLGRRNYKENSK